MGRITSNIGLITGIPITDTVDQLLQVAGAPRDLLVSRTQGLQAEQMAVNTLSTRLLSLQFEMNKLNAPSIFQAREVVSQDEAVLTAVLAADGTPPVSNFQVRSVQTASAQQLISQRFETLDDIQSTGTLSIGIGGFVDKGISLDELNSGAGVARGQIRITDLGGNTSVIDLSFARTVDDVLNTINTDTTINVTANAVGDTLTLTDNVGGGGTISVQEVAGGTTATDLGLGSISGSGPVETGADIFALHTGTKLTQLNDGNGMRITDDLTNVDDLSITLVDGTSAGVDLASTTTLGEVVNAINNDADFTGKLTAAIASDGNRLELTDLTSGGGTFSVANGVTGTAADDLGLTNTASGGVITGDRLVSGLRDTLLSSFNGGQGLGTLGQIAITDRAGGADTVDLASAETLGDIVGLVNGSTANVTASINAARNGITIVDSSAGSGTLTVANNDATNTADALGIAVNTAVASVDSGSLGRQTLSESTLLSSLNGNGSKGITASDISITDTNGKTVSLDLNTAGSEVKTIGDVIDAINQVATTSSLGVQARINDTGDGITIIDTVFGSATLGVKDVNGSLAADLNLTRASEIVNLSGQNTQVIDGKFSVSVDLSDLGSSTSAVSLASLNSGAGVDASDIKITDSAGKVIVLDLNGTDAGLTTVGQVIDKINEKATSLGAGITASINSSETGILLTDTAGGTGKLTVEDVNGTAAADLKIEGEAVGTTINGSGLFSAQSASQGALEAVASRINELESGVTASVLFDGIGYRLSLVGNQTGSVGEVLLDAAGTGFAFEETAAARDALLVLGEQQTVGSGVLISSSTNDFGEVISGVDLTIVSTSVNPVTVTVSTTDANFVSAVEDFVDAYNAIRSELDDLTEFNETDLTTGLLFGTNEALRVDTALSRVATDRYLSVGSFESLEQIGLGLDDKGKLQLDQSKLKQAFADNPNGLQTFFTDTDNGVVAKFNAAIDQLAGSDSGLLTNRFDTLQATIDSNDKRITAFNDSLDRQRERLLLQFYQLEEAIAGLRQSQTALQSLQPIAPLVSTAR